MPRNVYLVYYENQSPEADLAGLERFMEGLSSVRLARNVALVQSDASVKNLHQQMASHLDPDAKISVFSVRGAFEHQSDAEIPPTLAHTIRWGRRIGDSARSDRH